MSINEPKVSAMGRYSTSRTCTELGVSRSTLERYRKNGSIQVHYFKTNWRPFYYGKDIIALWRLSV